MRIQKLNVEGTPPAVRWAPATCVVGGKVFLFGGSGLRGNYNDVFCFDAATNIWKKIQATGTPPSARWGHSADLVGNKIYCFGGCKGNGKYCNDLHTFDIDSCKWTKVAFKKSQHDPESRAHFVTAVQGNKLIVHGGAGSSSKVFKDLYEFDLDKLEWNRIESSEPQPQARWGHCSVVEEGRLYIFGGLNGRTYYKEIWALDLKTLQWTQIPSEGAPPSMARYGHKGLLIGRTVLFTGGCSNAQFQGDIHALSLDTLKWTVPEHIEGSYPPRFNHMFEFVNGKCYIFGGTRGGVLFNDTYSLDVEEFKQETKEVPVELVVQTKKERKKSSREDRIDSSQLKKEKKLRKEAEKEKAKVQKRLKEVEKGLKEAEKYIEILTQKLKSTHIESETDGMETDAATKGSSTNESRLGSKRNSEQDLSDEETLTRKAQRLDLNQKKSLSAHDIIFPHEVLMAAICRGSETEQDLSTSTPDPSFFEKLLPSTSLPFNMQTTFKLPEVEIQKPFQLIYQTLFGDTITSVSFQIVEVIEQKLEELAIAVLQGNKAQFRTRDEVESMKQCMDTLVGILKKMAENLAERKRQLHQMKDIYQLPVEEGPPLPVTLEQVDKMLKNAEFVSLYCFHISRYTQPET